MKLIDGDALKEAVSNHPLIDFTDDDIFELIDKAPTVEPERPQGEWIFVSRQCYKCPFCNELSKGKNYCPNCGAWMKKGGNKNE